MKQAAYPCVRRPLLTLLVLLAASLAKGQEPVTLESKNLRVTLDPPSMSVDVRHLPTGVTWRMSRDGSREFVYEKNGKIVEASLAGPHRNR